MQDHIVVCSAGSAGRDLVEELLATGATVLAVDVDRHQLEEIAHAHPPARFTYVVGDATDDEIFAQLDLTTARGLIAALPSDKDNLYVTVSARQANPHLRIVARCAELSHVDKIRKSGADAVVSPNFIGGMRLVSEMVRPAVVGFLDAMLRDKRAAYRIEEVTLGANYGRIGETLRDARVRERFGMTVLAVRGEAKEWTYNPDTSHKLGPGTTLVVLGSAEQVALLRREMT